jgi:MarR family 2-MHQ and catechol resistance regulon transcriptional repressor
MVLGGKVKRECGCGKSAAGSYNQAMGERYLKSVRLLAECLQGFERFSGESVRRHGLTHAQFDIIATLGNTDGMTYKELGEKTLITKGTLTGVIERLESKGLVVRTRCLDDKRSFYVALSAEGQQVFGTVFPDVVEHGRQLFASYTAADFDAIEQTLSKFKQVITDHSTGPTTQQQKEEF